MKKDLGRLQVVALQSFRLETPQYSHLVGSGKLLFLSFCFLVDRFPCRNSISLFFDRSTCIFLFLAVSSSCCIKNSSTHNPIQFTRSGYDIYSTVIP